MVAYHGPGSVLIDFHSQFYFTLKVAPWYRYYSYEHLHFAKEETHAQGSRVT